MEQTQTEVKTRKRRKLKSHADFTAPLNGEVFVFGSNLSGFHGAGAALAAYTHYGVKLGHSDGFCGRSYAIPTKDKHIQTIKLDEIAPYVARFVAFTHANPEMEFFLTRIGCGLAGYADEDIAPMFRECNPDNTNFPEPWLPYLEG